MFTKNIQNQIFDAIIEESKYAIRKEMNEKAKKLEDVYKSMKYSATQNLVENAKVEVDKSMNLNVNIELNKSIPFENTEKQNIPMVLELGGAIKVKGGKPAPVGGRWMTNILGVKL